MLQGMTYLENRTIGQQSTEQTRQISTLFVSFLTKTVLRRKLEITQAFTQLRFFLSILSHYPMLLYPNFLLLNQKTDLCAFQSLRMFLKMQDGDHVLNHLLPKQLRSGRIILPHRLTTRFLNSFILKVSLLLNENFHLL